MYPHAFTPITLYRPMRVYKTALAPSASIGIPFVPDGDFLVRMVTDYRSHKAILRAEVDGDFKNLENLLRGRHQLSAKTMSSLSERLNVSSEELATWVHGEKDGPLAPNLLRLFSLLETVPGGLTSQVLAAPVFCNCCGANMLAGRDLFWARQLVSYAPAEVEFAERLLKAAVGAACVFDVMASIAGKTFPWENLTALVHPSKYPMGHWLELMLTHYQVSSLIDLSVKMQLMPAPECRVPYERLKKWSSGQDLMPVAVAKALIKGTSQPNRLWLCFMLARTITFVIDFLCSAGPIRPMRMQAQEIVYCRINALIANMRIAINAEKKRDR